MIRALDNWLDNRTGYKALLHEALYERVPGGARWRYVWGSTLVFTFMVQVITGIFLWAAYSPSTQTAWESVYYINNEMYLGNIVRGIHHFAAQAMVVLLAIHLVQVIIDGAYKAPREINFWIGLILMKIVLALSLTGYLLPWDQKGYYATQVTTKIIGATPVVGQQVQEIVQGGPKYGHHTLTRFFAMHAGILPGLLVVFLAIHIWVFRKHGLHVKDPDHAPETTFWPDQVLKDAVACLGVLAVILLLVFFKGAELSAPADPAEAYAAARPEWYFLFMFRFLKFELVEHFGLAFGALYVPGALFTFLVLMPIIALKKQGHAINVLFTLFMIGAIVWLTGLAMYEDKNNPDHQAAIAEAHRDAARIQELANRPEKIPVEGAVTLLREDPFTQGPRIFAKHCASCHFYNGHNGRGRILMESDPNDPSKKIPIQPTAADLGNFGSREWMRAAMIDYEQHFHTWTNASWYKEKSEEKDTEFLSPKPGESEMADWSKTHREMLTNPKNRKHLDGLVEFLAAQTGRKDLQIDEKLVEVGETLLSEYTLAEGELELSCTDCHDTLGGKFELTGDGSEIPDLAEYGSAKWLKAFISDPGTDQFYGSVNEMPAYKDKMTEREMDLLVRWLVKDYHPTEVVDYPVVEQNQNRPELTTQPAEQEPGGETTAANR